ncbi:MAG TPA: hypothetical protein VN894_10590, partial [Polyangiaceae bacterium]|nr:hypothetical protein [Polyangiaceae bacterium]
GHDLGAVHVTMDGETLLEKLDGSATAVDPGEHHFAFEAEGFRKSESTLLVREGEMDRPVRVVLVSTTAPPPGSEATSGGFDASTRRALGITLGAAGVAAGVVGGVFGILTKVTYDNASSECAGIAVGGHIVCTGTLEQQQKAQRDRSSAVSQATVSDVAFIGGGALLAIGAVLYFTALPTTPAGGEVAIAPTVTNEGAGFVVRGKW